jgi:predicted NBD/HSP70 family sugar kinase
MQLLHSEHASRKVNGQAVIQAIVAANAPVSRAELARELGLSKQTLSEITSLLEQSHWIQPVGRKQGALGRAAVSYELNPNACYVVGAILEGEQYAIGLADMRGNLRSKKEGKLTAKAQSDSTALSDSLVNLVQGLVEDAGISGDLVRHMVIGCPGVVDQVSMHVHHSPNLPSLQGLDLRKILSNKFNCAVQLDNDLNLHAYGEYRYGCSQKTLCSVFIGLGSGIGMGIMLDKQIWRGARGGAGEIGYMPVDRQPQSEEARRRGALECSLSAIDDGIDASHAAQSKADALARDCAFALACIVPILDPEIIVIGGTKGDDPELHARLGGWLDKFSVEKINVRRSALSADAGLRGAIALGVQACQDQLFLV